MWALVHEGADEAWKAAVARGAAAAPGAADRPDAFADALAAMVAEEKERLKAALAGGSPGAPTAGGTPAAGASASAGGRDALAAALEGLRFEVAELRGRLESLQASVDALLARRGD